jgi:hypothetical protein
MAATCGWLTASRKILTVNRDAGVTGALGPGTAGSVGEPGDPGSVPEFVRNRVPSTASACT